MPVIRPSSDLRNNYNEISTICHQTNRPVYITKNGAGDLAVMSIELYELLTDKHILYKELEKGISSLEKEENRKVKCDVAFVPVGGTYTMSFEEAAQLINEIKPQVAVPIHYGSVVGTKQDAIDFIKLLNPTINGVILMK